MTSFDLRVGDRITILPLKARSAHTRAELTRRFTIEVTSIRPDLDGRDVMTLLGVPPGPVIGRALAFLLELRMEEGPLGRDEAEHRLRDWWAAQS